MDADPIAGLESALHQAAGHGVRHAVPLREGQRADVDDRIGSLIGKRLGHAAQVVIDQH